MSSVADICNMALSHLGSDAIVMTIDPPDGSVESGHCARFYPIARAELLEKPTWGFARTRVLLAEVTNPSTTWAYAYALPSDCLVAKRVLNSYAVTTFWNLTLSGFATASELAVLNERGSADFDIEGEVLLTNEPEAVLLYVCDVTDPSKFTATFRTALSYLLASYLAGPLIKGLEGAKTGAQLRQVAAQVAGTAMEISANASSENAYPVAQSTQARL